MPVIRQLDPHVADLIAAGEVVERPASVVKELMENAIDAGASAVTVEIVHGGMTLIRVSDDGCGIPADQAATAFLRHATSKIATEYDLEAIGTLGFRGEALAAISAVSLVELRTRTEGEALGTVLTLEAGVVTSQEEAGCPKGTTLSVRDLFYNTPARLKFMKKDVAEGAAVFAVVQRVALSHPELSVKFLRDGKQELLTPGDGQMKSAVYAVLGRDIALGLLPVTGSGEGMGVSGFISLPACCRGSRGYQHFFVNGRYVKSRVMTAAMEEAYKNQKMVGKFPACVIPLPLRPSEVDVNVHPTKTEVKFQKEQSVYTAVYYAALSALDRDHTRPQASLSAAPKGEDTVTPNQTRLPMGHGPAARRPAVGADIIRPAAQNGPSRSALPLNDYTAPKAPVGAHMTVEEFKAAAGPTPQRPTAVSPTPFRRVKPLPVDEPAPKPSPLRGEGASRREADEGAKGEPAPVPEPGPAPEEEPWVVRGELFRTYVLVEQGEKVLLIDKHAAHERANFDRLKAADYKPMVQELLTPLTFTPAPEERALLLEQTALLTRFGFELEEFGSNALAVRSAPDYLDAGDIESALLELARRLRVTGTADPAGVRDELLHTMACKAAIKGGWRSGQEELEEVARMVMSGEVKYCPHGRPVAIELTKKQLEKQFKRA